MTGDAREATGEVRALLEQLRATGVRVNEVLALRLLALGEVTVALEIIRDTLSGPVENEQTARFLRALARELDVDLERRVAERRAFTLKHWWGQVEANPPLTRLDDALLELQAADEEHGSVSLEHESGWDLSYSAGRTLILEKVDSDRPGDRFHQRDVPAVTVKRLWLLLSEGRMREVLCEPWSPGYE